MLIFIMGRVVGFEPTHIGTTIRGLDHLTIPAIALLILYYQKKTQNQEVRVNILLHLISQNLYKKRLPFESLLLFKLTNLFFGTYTQFHEQ